MKILITGSAGFLGTELIKMLKKLGHTTIGIDLRRESHSHHFIQYDLRLGDPPLFPDFDLCIHLASSVGGFLFNASERSLPENELAIFEGVDAICKQRGCKRIIYTSTINVFERSGTYTHSPLPAIDCTTPYAVAKALTEREVQDRFQSFVILRPTNLFGATQTSTAGGTGGSHVIPELIEKIKTCGDTLEVLGDGTQVRNFLHVSDAALCIVLLLSETGQRWFNLRSEIHITISELAQTLLQIFDAQKSIRYETKFMAYEPASIRRFAIDPLSTIGWEPKITSIKEGLSGIIDSLSFQRASNDG